MTGEELARAFTKFVNFWGNNKEEKEFIETLTQREHRTLQQGCFNFIGKLIVAWSEQEQFDDRNEYTIKTCKKLVEAVPDLKHRAPFI